MSVSMMDRQTIQLVEAAFPGSRLTHADPLAGGISAQMVALTVTEADGSVRRMVLRRPSDGVLARNPQAARHEGRLLARLVAAGLPVPVPLHLADSHLFLDFIPGQTDLAPAHALDYARQMGEMLARIHRVDLRQVDLAFLPAQAETCAEIGPRSSAEMDDTLGEGRIRAALADAPPLARCNPVGLIHGDFWPGNLLWRDGKLAAVIDWEDARLADPLVDLGMVRSELSWILGMNAVIAFTESYLAHAPLDLADLPYWDLCAALRFIRLLGGDLPGLVAFFAPHGRADLTEQRVRTLVHVFTDQALDRLRPGPGWGGLSALKLARKERD